MEIFEALERMENILSEWEDHGFQSDSDINALYAVIKELRKEHPKPLPNCRCGCEPHSEQELIPCNKGQYDEKYIVRCYDCGMNTGLHNKKETAEEVWRATMG